MNAPVRTLFALLLGCGIAGPAAAATDAAPAGSTSAQNAAPDPQAAHLSQKLRNDLTKAGFTDITIMPSSFLVRAKDSEGHPVMMVINPEHHEAPLAGAIKGEPNSPIPSPPPKQ
jgi:hypothetical protein